MALENNIELLDDYVANRLSATDKAAFEQQLQADPQLKNEVQIQQRIAEGIRQARIAELKTMLGNVPVAGLTGGQMSGFAKVAVGTITAAAIAVVGYFVLKQDESVETKPSAATEVNPETVTTVPQEAKTEQEAEVTEESTSPSRKTKEPAKPNKTNKAEPRKDEKVATRPSINAFDPSVDSGESSSKTDDAAQAVIENSSPVSSSKIVAEVDNTNKKYKFHYYLKANKVTLYGDFERSLYEIIEVFNNEKRTAFLFFHNNYYLMNEEGDKIKPLSPISDPVLIKKLDAYRAQKN